MHDAHAAGAQARLQPVMPGVLRKFRFRARLRGCAAAAWTTPVLFVRTRDARSLVDDSYETEAAC